MDEAALFEFVASHMYAVQASSSPSGPQAAVIGVAVTDQRELVFDTLGDTRKAVNLRSDPRIALVVFGDAQTAQIEGLVDEPSGEELARIKRAYFARFPDGVERETWPLIAYFRVRPTWVRYSDFRGPEARVVELRLGETRV
ncbi:MAG: pyridoxamine 5'-phosphate oxidase family protein [Polyangiaceae bacterium]